jgi:undecaprenyl-diphosphatase
MFHPRDIGRVASGSGAFDVGESAGEPPRTGIAISTGRIALWSSLLVLCIAAMAALLRFPNAFDYPVTLFINESAPNGRLFQTLALDISLYWSVSGALFVTAVWYCWFAGDPAAKARLLTGTAAAFLSGVVGRYMQHKLPTHHRPLHDPGLPFHLPQVVNPNSLNAWNSFPSDHAAVWFGLAVLVMLMRPRLGMVMLVWAFVTDLSRNYLGYHYPTDIIAGAALGPLLVLLSQAEWLQRPARRFVGWGEQHGPVFYAGAFLISYEIASLFSEVRDMLGGLTQVFDIKGF